MRARDSRFGLFAWVACAPILLARTASATTVTYGNDLSIALPDTTCFDLPASLHEDSLCAGTHGASMTSHGSPQVAGIADAWVRLGKDTYAGVTILRLPPAEVLPETDDDAADAVTSMGKALKRGDRSVTGFYRGPSKLYMTADQLRIVRCSADLTYQGSGGDVEYVACAFAYGANATYWISASGPKEMQADIDPIVDDAVSSIHVEKPLQQSKAKRRWTDVGYFVLIVLGLFAAGVVHAFLRRLK